MKRVAVNGMGRLGRAVVREALQAGEYNATSKLDIVAVNDIASIDEIAYLLRYDSVHGKLPDPVTVDGDTLCYRNHRIRYVQSAAIASLPWRDLDVDVVVEATGQATSRRAAAGHLAAGVRRVLIAAPSPDADFTAVMGVNEGAFDSGKHHVVSNASCTTNSLAPVLKVLLDRFGIEQVGVTTVHAYTASQGLVDRPARKKHRGRAAAMSIVPTSTGADRATVQVLPALANRISACSLRVPVPDGSISDITVQLGEPVEAEWVNAALLEAAESSLRGVLGYTADDVVSADILGEPYSGIVHARSTQSVGEMIKLQVWYDNETGYACRCLDMLALEHF